MHEFAVTQNILDAALHHAREAGAARVTDLYLVIGELSSIVDDSVQFYWEFVTESTAAAGSTLHFRRIPAKMRCLVCRSGFSPYDTLLCPECGSGAVEIVAGVSFYLEAIDVEHDTAGVPS